MRAYTVTTVAITLQVPTKWLDNILSHHKVPGVTQGTQGIARRLTPEAVTVLEITLMLCRSLAIPAPRSLQIATRLLLEGGATARYSADDTLAVVTNVEAIRADIARRLADAVESAPRPRRGRPPSKAQR